MNPESLREIAPTLITLTCCGGFMAGLFGLIRLLRNPPKPHGRFEKSWNDMTVGDAWGLNKIGSKRFTVDGDQKTVSGPKFK